MRKLAVVLALFMGLHAYSQKALDEKDVYIVLKNKLTPEVLEFLQSDTVTNGAKTSYLNLANGSTGFSEYTIPEKLKNAYLDPLAYGLGKENYFYITRPDSNTTSYIFIHQIENYTLFKSAFENAPLANFDAKNGVIELYKNTTFIKGNRLVYIYSHDLNWSGRHYDNDKYVYRSNFSEAREHTIYTYNMTDEEYNEIISTPLHLRQDPDDKNVQLATKEQIKQHKTNSFYDRRDRYSSSYYYDYDPTYHEDHVRYSSADEKAYYEDELIPFSSDFETNKSLSFYNYKGKNYYENNNYDRVDSPSYYEDNEYDYAADTVSVAPDEPYYDEVAKIDEILREATESVDSAASAYEEDYSYNDYDPYEGFSKRDIRKLKRLQRKEDKIYAKLYKSEEVGDYAEEDLYDTAAYYGDNYNNNQSSRKAYSIPCYVRCELFDNKRYVAPFLEKEVSTNIKQKSFSDFKNSKAATVVWVNQEVITGFFWQELFHNSRRRYDKEKKESESNFLNNTYLLLELDYSKSTNFTANIKGYGPANYLSEIKNIFNTQTPQNWIANMPNQNSLIASYAFDNTTLFSFYKKYIQDLIKNSTQDTILKESLHLALTYMDEEAISKIFSGKSLAYINGTTTYTNYYKTYDYDNEYNYVSKDTSRTMTVPVFVSFFGTNDTTTVRSILNLIEYYGHLRLRNGIYSVYNDSWKRSHFDEKEDKEPFYLTLLNNALVVSNDSLALVKIRNNKKTADPNLIAQLAKNKIYFKIDSENLATLLKETNFDKENRSFRYLKEFKSLEINGLDFDNEKFTLNLKYLPSDNNKNSLISIYELLEMFY
jgi:hypothetical protein